MSGICGWLSIADARDPHSQIQDMVHALISSDGETIQKVVEINASIASAGSATRQLKHDEILVIVQGCPIWATDTPSELSQEPQFLRSCAVAYKTYGASFLKYVYGQFALAVIDLSNREILLAVDRTGTENICYSASSGAIVFANSADALLRHNSVRDALNPQALFDYLYFHVVPGPQTIYQDVFRLPPGTYLHGTPRQYSVDTYWQPDYRNITFESFASRKRTLRELLHQSVADAMCGAEVGAFLSGGTDSSTVAGMLTEVLGQGARTYSIGFDAPGYDESDYARTAARHFGTRHHEYYVTPSDVAAAIPRLASKFDMPFGNASAIPAYYCAKLAAEDGITTLLGGDGGDEIFGGNTRYAKQWVFSLYEQIPSALRNQVLEPGLKFLPAVGPFRKVRSYVDQANLGMPDRIESYNLLTRLGANKVFDPDFLQTINTEHPIELVRDIYNSANASDTLNRMLALDMRITLADNDLRKVTRACDAAGVNVTFPLLDYRLIAFAQQLPSDWKVKRTRLRDFFKRSLADFLPKQVITKSKHGFGLPFGVWMRNEPQLRELANDRLDRLRQRNIFQPSFIDELTSTRVEQHAAYYGTMIWVLIMLEQWLMERSNSFMGR